MDRPPVDRPPVRQRGWAEVRWRQFRNAPRPVVRAVMASLVVATALAIGYVAYDVALARGALLPGGDLRRAALAVYAVPCCVIGSVVTWLIVPAADRVGHGPAAQRVERGPRLLRRGADRLARDGRRDPGRPPAARMTHSGPCARVHHFCNGAPAPR